jgi:hypothetical protein
LATAVGGIAQLMTARRRIAALMPSLRGAVAGSQLAKRIVVGPSAAIAFLMVTAAPKSVQA